MIEEAGDQELRFRMLRVGAGLTLDQVELFGIGSGSGLTVTPFDLLDAFDEPRCFLRVVQPYTGVNDRSSGLSRVALRS